MVCLCHVNRKKKKKTLKKTFLSSSTRDRAISAHFHLLIGWKNWKSVWINAWNLPSTCIEKLASCEWLLYIQKTNLVYHWVVFTLPSQMAVFYFCRVSFFLANFLRPLLEISNDGNLYMLRLIFMKLDHNDIWLCLQVMHDLWPWSRSHGGSHGSRVHFHKKGLNSTILRMVMLLVHMTDLDIPNKSYTS